MLNAISPIDGRYSGRTKELAEYFSEYALIKYRVFVEVQYFIALYQHPLPELSDIDMEKVDLNAIFENFNLQDAIEVKNIEKTTNHDVKAVEYYIKSKFDEMGLSDYKEFIHFGLTSQDINNTATPLLLKHAMEHVYLPLFNQLKEALQNLATEWSGIPCLLYTSPSPRD